MEKQPVASKVTALRQKFEISNNNPQFRNKPEIQGPCRKVSEKDVRPISVNVENKKAINHQNSFGPSTTNFSYESRTVTNEAHQEYWLQKTNLNNKLLPLSSNLNSSGVSIFNRHGVYVEDSGSHSKSPFGSFNGKGNSDHDIESETPVLDDNISENGSSNGSSLTNKCNVRRRNAFRQKDVITYGSKTSLERGNSLELEINSLSHEIMKRDYIPVGLESSTSSDPSPNGIKSSSPKQLNQLKAVNVVTPYRISSSADFSSNPTMSYSTNLQRSKSSTNHMLKRELPRYTPPPAPTIYSSNATTNVPMSLQIPENYKPKPRPLSYSEATESGSESLTKTRTNSNPSAIPPEKPPRTFLYDILSDNHYQRLNLKKTINDDSQQRFNLDQEGVGHRPNNSVARQNPVTRSNIRKTVNGSSKSLATSLGSLDRLSSEDESLVLGIGHRIEPNRISLANVRPINSQQPSNESLGFSSSSHSRSNRFASIPNSSPTNLPHFSHQSSNSRSIPNGMNLITADETYAATPLYSGKKVTRNPPINTHHSTTNNHKFSRLPRSKTESEIRISQNPDNLPGFKSPALHHTQSNTLLQNYSQNRISQKAIALRSQSVFSGLPDNRICQPDDRFGSKSYIHPQPPAYGIYHDVSKPKLHPAGHNNFLECETTLRQNAQKANQKQSYTASSNSLKDNRTTLPEDLYGLVGKSKMEYQNSIQNLITQVFNGRNGTDSDSGLQIGSESLSSCDTPLGDSTTDTGDSDCENDLEGIKDSKQVVEKRKGYIRRVSSINACEIPSMRKLYKCQDSELHETQLQCNVRGEKNGPLYETLLLVSMHRDRTNGNFRPYIISTFPSTASVPEGIEEFCFPDSEEWPCHEGTSAQFYTLIITDAKGVRKYGTCFRLLPDGANVCIPIVYCLISPKRAIGFYRDLLQEIVSRHSSSEVQRNILMTKLYEDSLPEPGKSLLISDPVPYREVYVHPEVIASQMSNIYNYEPSNSISLKVRRKPDPRLENNDLVTLLRNLDINIVIKLFSSILHERKIILLSKSLTTLSLSIESLESMLYPFTWPWPLVTILPLHIEELLDVPVPFMIGVLRSTRNQWSKKLDDGIVVDLDQNRILSCVGDEATILPKRISRRLREALQLVLSMTDQRETTQNVLISECFIRLFVETIGNYEHFLTVQSGYADSNSGGKSSIAPKNSRSEHLDTESETDSANSQSFRNMDLYESTSTKSNYSQRKSEIKVFDRDSFISSSDSKSKMNFLEWFTETSLFHQFITSITNGTYQRGLFDQRVIEQLEQTQLFGSRDRASSTPGSNKTGNIFSKGTNWLKETFGKDKQ